MFVNTTRYPVSSEPSVNPNASGNLSRDTTLVFIVCCLWTFAPFILHQHIIWVEFHGHLNLWPNRDHFGGRGSLAVQGCFPRLINAFKSSSTRFNAYRSSLSQSVRSCSHVPAALVGSQRTSGGESLMIGLVEVTGWCGTDESVGGSLPRCLVGERFLMLQPNEPAKSSEKVESECPWYLQGVWDLEERNGYQYLILYVLVPKVFGVESTTVAGVLCLMPSGTGERVLANNITGAWLKTLLRYVYCSRSCSSRFRDCSDGGVDRAVCAAGFGMVIEDVGFRLTMPSFTWPFCFSGR